jgi:hypothetical protein
MSGLCADETDKRMFHCSALVAVLRHRTPKENWVSALDARLSSDGNYRVAWRVVLQVAIGDNYWLTRDVKLSMDRVAI